MKTCEYALSVYFVGSTVQLVGRGTSDEIVFFVR